MRLRVGAREFRVGDQVMLAPDWWARIAVVREDGFSYEGDVHIFYDDLGPGTFWIERSVSRNEAIRDLVRVLEGTLPSRYPDRPRRPDQGPSSSET